MKLRKLFLAVALSALAAAAARQIPAAGMPTLTGAYSDMHSVPGTGDVFGTEILIVEGTDAGSTGLWAVVQLADGRPGKPLVAKVEQQGADVRFAIPDGSGGTMTFTGTVTASSLAGHFDRDGGKLDLRRGRSFWR